MNAELPLDAEQHANAPHGASVASSRPGAAEAATHELANAPAASDRRALLAHLRARALYWSPVFVLMVLFGEIAFLGLRPALAEKRRLDVAEVAVAERLASAQDKRAAVDLQLRARTDPIYQERLRRLRIHPPVGN